MTIATLVKKSIGTGLHFERLSPLLSRLGTRQHTGEHGAAGELTSLASPRNEPPYWVSNAECSALNSYIHRPQKQT